MNSERVQHPYFYSFNQQNPGQSEKSLRHLWPAKCCKVQSLRHIALLVFETLKKECFCDIVKIIVVCHKYSVFSTLRYSVLCIKILSGKCRACNSNMDRNCNTMFLFYVWKFLVVPSTFSFVLLLIVTELDTRSVWSSSLTPNNIKKNLSGLSLSSFYKTNLVK